MTHKQQESINLETTLEELENIVKTMESKQLDLQKALELFERGMNLTKVCQKTLLKAEQKVQQLTQGTEQLSPVTFQEEQEEN